MTTRFHVGTSGYAYREWKPAFYPPETPASKFLPFYAERFRSVEINGSFYRPPTEKSVLAWAAQTPPGFSFSFKAPQLITHIRRLRGVDADVAAFRATVAALGRRLGALLFQLPPFAKKDLPLLTDFLPLLKGARCAMEFRHPSWFDDAVFAALETAGIALCWNDADVESMPFESTAAWGYARLRRVSYTPAEIRAWGRRLSAAGWKEAYVYFKHEDTASGPRLAAALTKALG